jgi:hypothetical protein
MSGSGYSKLPNGFVWGGKLSAQKDGAAGRGAIVIIPKCPVKKSV